MRVVLPHLAVPHSLPVWMAEQEHFFTKFLIRLRIIPIKLSGWKSRKYDVIDI